MQCVKCGKPASLKSPSGTPYCSRCGRCTRNVYGTMKGIVVLRKECRKTVDQFVIHPRMRVYVCPCVLDYDREMQKIERSAS